MKSPPFVFPPAAAATMPKITTHIKGTHLLHSRLLQPRRNQRIHIRKGIGVIRLAQIQPDVVQSFALRQMVIIGIGEEGRTHPADQGLGEAVEDVEGGQVPGRGLWGRRGHDFAVFSVYLL